MGKTRQAALAFLFSNRMANVLVLVTCAAVLSSLYWRSVASPDPAARESVWPAGSTLEIDGLEHGRGLPTLLVFVQSKCRYCADEMPFYLEMHQAQRRGARYEFVFAGPEPLEVLRKYADENGLLGIGVLSVSNVPGLRATPTVALIDSDRRLVRSWQGVLNSDQKRQLLDILWGV